MRKDKYDTKESFYDCIGIYLNESDLVVQSGAPDLYNGSLQGKRSQSYSAKRLF